MPEIVGATEEAITRDLREQRPLFRNQIEALVENYDRELVGSGAECVVVSHKDQPQKVVALDYRGLTPEEAKETFYLQRLFSTLFPHNFPHFYAVFGEFPAGTVGSKNISGSVRERVLRTEQAVKYPFDKVIEFCKNYLVPFEFDIEGSAHRFNLLVGEDGGEYYLDKIENPYYLSHGWKWRLSKIMTYMKEAKSEEGKPLYDPIDQRIVRRSVQRLASLGLISLTKEGEEQRDRRRVVPGVAE